MVLILSLWQSGLVCVIILVLFVQYISHKVCTKIWILQMELEKGSRSVYVTSFWIRLTLSSRLYITIECYKLLLTLANMFPSIFYWYSKCVETIRIPNMQQSTSKQWHTWSLCINIYRSFTRTTKNSGEWKHHNDDSVAPSLWHSHISSGLIDTNSVTLACSVFICDIRSQILIYHQTFHRVSHSTVNRKISQCTGTFRETDRESRLGGLVLMGVSSSELLSSSSDSSDWISSTMDRRGPERDDKSHRVMNVED